MSSSSIPFYVRIRDEHWLRDKQESGRIAILEDESVWEVAPPDWPITQRWLRGSTLIVGYTEKENHPYLLRNITENEVARAKFLGNIPAAGWTSELFVRRWI